MFGSNESTRGERNKEGLLVFWGLHPSAMRPAVDRHAVANCYDIGEVPDLDGNSLS